MKKLFLMSVVCLMVVISFSSCNNKSFESIAKSTMKETIREVAMLPQKLKLHDEKVVFSDDSLCIIHADFHGKSLSGLDLDEKIEYIFIKSNGEYFEAYHSIINENPIYVSEDVYHIIKKNKIYERLSYNMGLRYLSSLFVRKEGRSLNSGLNQINIPGNTGLWEKMQFVDEFKEKTEKSFLIVEGSGVFSNSATLNSDLSVYFYYEKDSDFSLKLFEYNRSLVRDDSYYNAKIKDSRGNVYSMKLFNGRQSGLFYAYKDKDKATMKKILENGGMVTFSLEEISSSYYTVPSSYFFTINVEGFTNALKTLEQ